MSFFIATFETLIIILIMKYKLNKDCFVYCVQNNFDKDLKFKKGFILGESINEGEEVMIFENEDYGSMYVSSVNIEAI